MAFSALHEVVGVVAAVDGVVVVVVAFAVMGAAAGPGGVVAVDVVGSEKYDEGEGGGSAVVGVATCGVTGDGWGLVDGVTGGGWDLKRVEIGEGLEDVVSGYDWMELSEGTGDGVEGNVETDDWVVKCVWTGEWVEPSEVTGGGSVVASEVTGDGEGARGGTCVGEEVEGVVQGGVVVGSEGHWGGLGH